LFRPFPPFVGYDDRQGCR